MGTTSRRPRAVAACAATVAAAGLLAAAPAQAAGRLPQRSFTVATGPVYAVARDARTGTVLAADTDDDRIFVVTGRRVSTGHGGGCCGQYDLAVDPGLAAVYAVGIDDETYSADARTGQRTADLHTGLEGSFVAVDPRTHDVYVTGLDPATGRYPLVVVDGRTDQVVRRLRVDAGAVLVDSALRRVLVGTSSGVLVVDATTHRVLRRARVPSGVMSLDPGSHVVYSLSQDAVTGRPRVAAFDDRTFALRFDVELPSTDYPSSIAVDPERQVVLVGLYESHQLAAIDPARGRVLGRIALTGAPLDLVVRPRDGRVYVATDGRGIDVLD